MTSKSDALEFKDAFWGTNFTSYAGFEALHQRMKDGKQFMDDFTTYCKQRAQLEENYGKALIKLGRSLGGNTEIGTLRESWEALKAETEELGNVHYRNSQQLQQEIETPNREFREKQRMARKKTEDLVKKSQKLKTSSYNNNIKARKLYENKCREAERADEEVKKGCALPPKDVEKLKLKAKKARAAAENADAAYREAVRTLDETRQQWEREMTRCCIQFQQAEIERIEFMRNAMWFFTNCCSATSVRDDQRYEAMRLVIEKCDVDEVMQLFIKEKATGYERPAAIKYASFYAPNGEIATDSLASMSGGNSGGGSVLSSITGRISRVLGVNEIASSNNEATAIGSASESSGVGNGAGGGATAAPTNGIGGSSSTGEIVRVAFDYEAQGNQELSLKKGEEVEVLGKMDATWWRGKLKGKVGMFPQAFVQPI